MLIEILFRHLNVAVVTLLSIWAAAYTAVLHYSQKSILDVTIVATILFVAILINDEEYGSHYVNHSNKLKRYLATVLQFAFVIAVILFLASWIFEPNQSSEDVGMGCQQMLLPDCEETQGFLRYAAFLLIPYTIRTAGNVFVRATSDSAPTHHGNQGD